jgi:hypothetical protein
MDGIPLCLVEDLSLPEGKMTKGMKMIDHAPPSNTKVKDIWS